MTRRELRRRFKEYLDGVAHTEPTIIGGLKMIDWWFAPTRKIILDELIKITKEK